MAYGPKCKNDLKEGSTTCYICGYEIDGNSEGEWVLLGSIEDKLSADYARETLKSYEIPAVIISRSGFFGDVGLVMNPFYKKEYGNFEVKVPKEYIEEATDILNMILGEKWQREIS